MTLFVDASALVAMIADEAERDIFLDAVDAADESLWSAMSCWETVSAMRRIDDRLSVMDARALVEAIAALLSLRLVAIGQAELTEALDAYQKFGRGSGHPAKLNFGDCFAYACAKVNDAKLLYKGDDFAKTDLA